MTNPALSILDAAEEVPERPAWLFAQSSGESSVRTYAQVAEDVRREMAALRRQVLPAIGQPIVPVVGELRPETLTRIYALIELGVPLALVHPRWTEAERARRVGMLPTESVLGRGTPMWVPWAGGRAFGSGLEPPPTPEGAHIGTPLHREEPDTRPRTGSDLSSPLALLFTSGTTGDPKAAVLSRRAFLAAADASTDNLGWVDGDRWWLGLPLGHVGGLSVLTRCLIARRTVVLQGGDAGFDAAEAAEVVERCGVTLMSLVPTMLRRLLDLPGWTPPASLRAVLLGGAATSVDLLAEARERGVPVLTTYGSTETCAQVATQRYSLLDEGALLNKGAREHPEDGTVGPPLEGVEVRIAGAGTGQQDEGEIEVRGATVMDGYLSVAGAEPGLDRSSFTTDGWLRTGDLGRLDEQGRLQILGRTKDLIISGGENVHPAAVEAVLLRHPGIAAACVFGVEDAHWGEVVAAALVATDPAHPPQDANLLNFLETQLARFQRPRRVSYVEALDVNATGKVDRRAVAARVRDDLRPL